MDPFKLHSTEYGGAYGHVSTLRRELIDLIGSVRMASVGVVVVVLVVLVVR